ncbi:MAG: branched-chain amino acid ABC transporter permease [Deltaproteobacteria bacterium]|nr:branched-chain amino acid ABC transporter permease [Deltaproteobacteria bacterium]
MGPIDMHRGKILEVIILIIASALLPLVVRNPYYVHLLIMVGINAVLSMTFVLMLRTGLISLAIAAFWGIGAYSSALLTLRFGLPVWLAMPSAVLITGVVGALIGALLVKQGGFGFIIQTLALGFIVLLVFGTFKVFGGYVGLVGIPYPEPIPIPFGGSLTFSPTSKISYFYLMLCLVLLIVLVLAAFYSGWAGRAWRAIGLSPRLAESLGINLFRYRLLAFLIASSMAGLMGSFYAHYYGALVPGTFGPFKTIYVHVYAILGGIEFPILGPMVGALIMTFVPELLRITEGAEPIFTGILVILLILFLPSGLLGLTNVARHKR